MVRKEGIAVLKDAPIGVFDSGVGGLTVVREIIRQLPSENVVYFGAVSYTHLTLPTT